MKSLTKNYLAIGALLFVSSIQFFFAQAIVQHSWHSSFSLRYNYISDLGNTTCGYYFNRYVCSPDFRLMNISFILLGLTMFIGSLLIVEKYSSEKMTKLGFYLLAGSGAGTLLVGSFPENVRPGMHGLGAALIFLLGNLAMLFIGLSKLLPRWLRIYSIFSGSIGLIALVLFIIKLYLGLGVGGTERLVAYPQTIWMIVFGVYLLANYSKIVKESK